MLLGFVILYISKHYKVNSSFKEKVSTRYEFITGLRWLRASSPAKFRPPFAQIWVTNLFPMLRARPGMSSKSAGDRLKFGLFTIFPCVQPAFMKATVVPREASRAQKSPCPAITSSSASTSPSINMIKCARQVFNRRFKLFGTGSNWVEDLFQPLNAPGAEA